MRKNNPFSKIEDKIGSLFEKEQVLFTRNGTTAIWLILEVLGFKGKRVILPANVCFVVVCAVILSGNEPYFVDIDKDFSIDPQKIKDIDPGEAAAVILPHMYGNIGSIEQVLEIAREKKWLVIEDAAQALGAKKSGKYAGSFSDFSIASFGMGKIIDVNAGGVLCTTSRQVYEKARQLYASLPVLDESRLNAYLRFNQIYCALIDCLERGDDVSRFGKPLALSYRDANLNKLSSDLEWVEELEKKLTDLDDELGIRNTNARAFQSIFDHSNVTTVKHGAGATYWRQNVLVKIKRDQLLAFLKRNGVKASKYFPSIDRLFQQGRGRRFEKSDQMASQAINLWPGKETSRNDIFKINDLIKEFYQNDQIGDRSAISI